MQTQSPVGLADRHSRCQIIITASRQKTLSSTMVLQLSTWREGKCGLRRGTWPESWFFGSQPTRALKESERAAGIPCYYYAHKFPVNVLYRRVLIYVHTSSGSVVPTEVSMARPR